MEQTLRDVIEPLAALERGAGSPGEKLAAELLADMFDRVSARVQIDEEEFRAPNYARLLLPLGVVGMLCALAVARGRAPRLAGALAAAGFVLTVDDVENGRRWWRRAVGRKAKTWNVVAEVGDPSAARTLVVLGHHDAAPTGQAFDPSLQRAIAARYPEWVQKTDTALPIWWPNVAGPVLTVLAALTGRRGLARVGVGFGLLSVGLGADIARGRIVPGANDNLSGSAALVALAERLRDAPLSGLRVVLASCGAEEVLQGGIYGFRDRHLARLNPASTWVLNLDTIGCPELFMLEGEGPFWMHDYVDPAFRDRIARVTEQATGKPLRRGCRARASTDSIVPSRAGFPTATLCSWEPDTKLMSNYHLMTDTPDRLRWETIERAVVVCEAVARDLAADA